MTRRMQSVRDSLRSVSTAVGAGTVLGMGSQTVSGSEEVEVEIVFEDQVSDGESVVVDYISTSVDASVRLYNRDGTGIGSQTHLTAGEERENVFIQIDEDDVLSDDTELSVVLRDMNASERIESTRAMIEIGDPSRTAQGIQPTRIDADPSTGFNYPYFLYAPPITDDEDPKPVLVESSSGPETDDQSVFEEEAKSEISREMVRSLSDALGAPCIVPAFPRPRTDPVDHTYGIHGLDDRTMEIDSGPLERIDLQLLRMVEHARNELEERGYPVDDDGIMLNGFSSTGDFAERFTALHPEEVISVTAGGVNGMVTLPIEEAKGHTLNYPVGVANVESLTGEPFNLEAFREVNQLLYLGEFDDSDTIPYEGAFRDEMREVALDVFGKRMQWDRFPVCRAVHEEVGTNAVIRLYEGIGHNMSGIGADLIEFHRRSLAGDDIEEIRRDFQGGVPNPRARIEFTPKTPRVGEQVAFNAVGSAVWDTDVVEFTWEFDEDSASSGELATHSFDSSGWKVVSLVTVDEDGETHRSEEFIEVKSLETGEESPEDDGENSNGDEEGTEDEDEDDGSVVNESPEDSDGSDSESGSGGEAGSIDEDDSDDSDDSASPVPGLGVASAVTGIGGVLYALSRRASAKDPPE